MTYADYNSDVTLCRLCDDNAAVWNGLCDACLAGGEHEPGSGKFTLRHAPKRRKNRKEEDDE
jgi:predicted amidophosphoribosyltransferase